MEYSSSQDVSLPQTAIWDHTLLHACSFTLVFVYSVTTSLHLFNGFFSRTTWVSQYQKGKTSLDLNGARDYGVLGCSHISWTICMQSAPHSRQITTPTPHHSFFTGRMLFLMPNQQWQSTEGIFVKLAVFVLSRLQWRMIKDGARPKFCLRLIFECNDLLNKDVLHSQCTCLLVLLHISDVWISKFNRFLCLLFCRSQWNREHHSFTWNTGFTSSWATQVGLMVLAFYYLSFK